MPLELRVLMHYLSPYGCIQRLFERGFRAFEGVLHMETGDISCILQRRRAVFVVHGFYRHVGYG